MIGDSLELERRAIADAVDGRTLVDVLARNATQHGGGEAIAWRDQGDWRRYTWSEYRHHVLIVAAALMELGVEPGERIAIMAGNRPEHVLADLGAMHAGATPVTVYMTLADDQLAYVAAHSRAVVAIVDSPETLERWRAARGQLPDLRTVIVLDPTDGELGEDLDVRTWDELMEAGAWALNEGQGSVERRAATTTPDSTATLIYTSGTTGEPKGVVISQANVLWTLETMSRAINLPEAPRFVSYLPLAHIAERMATHYLGMWVVGEVTYCANVGAVMGVVKEVRPHLFVGVPRIWEQVYRRVQAKLDAEDDRRRRALAERALSAGAARGAGSTLRRAELAALDLLVLRKIRSELGLDRAVMAITTAGPIDPDIIRFFQAVGIPLHELYGMTECSGPATTNLPGFDKVGSVGRAFAGVEVEVLPDGELLIRGGNVAVGYEQAPAETAAVFDSAGWLHTGDLAEIDSAGFVTIVGRKKDIIVNAAGKNIAPVGIEQLLKRHPIVAEACVVGDRKPNLGVLVVPDPETATVLTGSQVVDPSDERLRAAIQVAIDETNDRVSKVERIRRFEIITDEWSPETGVLTPSMKVRRNVVLDRYAEIIAAL